jgi:hypothetical protein
MINRIHQLVPFSFLVLASCNSSEPSRLPTVPVSGSVVFADKKPAVNAWVVFHPVDPAVTVRPRGKVVADGSFQLTTYDGLDGAPAGKYRVTVELWLAGRTDDGPSNRLPARYASPDTSGLEATVAADTATLTPFVVKR